MAQQVERVLGKDEVTGSNPVSSSTKKSGTLVPLFLWKCKAYIEPVTEVRTWFCFSKADEVTRNKNAFNCYVRKNCVPFQNPKALKLFTVTIRVIERRVAEA